MKVTAAPTSFSTFEKQVLQACHTRTTDADEAEEMPGLTVKNLKTFDSWKEKVFQNLLC